MKKNLLMIGSSFMKHWHFESKHYTITNQGRSGLFSRELLYARHFNLLEDAYKKADIVFFYSGANDIDRRQEDPDLVIQNNIRFLEFLLCQSPSRNRIFVFSLLKSPRILANSSKLAAFEKINRHMREYCREHSRLTYVDFNRLVTSPECYFNENHLNDYGYQKVESKLAKVIPI